MRYLPLLIVCLFSQCFAAEYPSFPFVYVQGTASREIPPNSAFVKFTVRTHHESADEAFKLQSAAADSILNLSAEVKISRSDVVAEPISKRVRTKRDDPSIKSDTEIIGYTLWRSVRIDVKDLESFPRLISFLYRHTFVEDINVQFRSKEEISILQSLTAEACSEAQAKAERLCDGFKQKLGSVRAISEGPLSRAGGTLLGAAEDTGELRFRGTDVTLRDFSVIPTSITLQKNVYVIFSID